MGILSKEEAKQILEKVISFSKADSLEAGLSGSSRGNIRYARNSVSTSGFNEDISLAVTANFGKRSASSTINEFDDASLRKVVKRAEELAQLAPENPEFMEPLGPQEFKESNTYFEATANITPEFRAEVAAAGIVPAKANDVTVAGYLEDGAGFSSIMNSKGLFAYSRSTDLAFTATMRTNDGTGS
ncbi:MAG: putative Zn-dependent protease, partial [Marivirga sp.]